MRATTRDRARDRSDLLHYTFRFKTRFIWNRKQWLLKHFFDQTAKWVDLNRLAKQSDRCIYTLNVVQKVEEYSRAETPYGKALNRGLTQKCLTWDKFPRAWTLDDIYWSSERYIFVSCWNVLRANVEWFVFIKTPQIEMFCIPWLPRAMSIFFTKRLFVIKDLFNAHTLNEAQNNATEFYMYQQTAVLILNAFFSDYTSMCARPFSSEQFPHLCSAHLVSVSILLPRLRQFGVVLWYNVMFTTRNKKSISTISRLTGQRFGNKNCLVISAIDWAAVTSKCENLAKLFFAFSPVIISLYPL